MNARHEEFRKAMLDANIRQVARFVTPKGLEPKSEIHVWLGVNGVFLTQTWGKDEGEGYELYFPTREQGREEAIAEAVKFATVKIPS